MDVPTSPMHSPNTPSTPALSESTSPSSSGHALLEQDGPSIVDVGRRASSSAVLGGTSKRHSIHWDVLDASAATTSPSSREHTPILGSKLPPLQRCSSDRETYRPSRPRGSSHTSSRSMTRVQHHPNPSSSRPSSMASSSSAGECSSHQARFGVNASLLSPSLASALGIGVEGRKPASSLYSSSRSSSTTSLVGLATCSPSALPRGPRRSIISAKASSSALGTALASVPSSGSGTTSNNFRRPSLPNVAVAQNRSSTISVSSFESLPEGQPVPASTAPSFAGATTDPLQRSATFSDLPSRGPVMDSLEFPSLMLPPSALPAHPKSSTSPTSSSTSNSVTCASVPSSPVGREATFASTMPFPCQNIAGPISSASSSASRRRALHRSQTEPTAGFPTARHEENMRKRGLVARELLTTEQAFVSSLLILHEAFYQPLLARCAGNRSSPSLEAGPMILSKKAINDIFSNFVDILQLNKELLGQLEERIGGKVRLDRAHTMASMRRAVSPVVDGTVKPADPNLEEDGRSALSSTSNTKEESNSSTSPSSARCSWNPETDTVGDILVPIAPFLKMYSLYVKNFSSAIAHIESERRDNEAFARFLKETERSTWGRGKAFFGLGLQSHLLTIVQRIPRYKLLVGDLLKHTPSNHRDYADLKKAFQVIEQVASTINENVRQHEMVMLMLALQRSLTGLTSPLVVPGRSLLRRGTLRKACRKDIQHRAFFLFTDCIIYARPLTGGSASIEAAWNSIARAGGFSAAGLAAGIGGPWSTPSAAGSPRHALASVENSSDGHGGRARVSSGNLFSGNGIFEALQAQQHQQLQFREKYALQDCTVVGVEDGHNSMSNASPFLESGGTPFSFEIRTPDKSFAVYAETADSREAWMTAIRDARNEWLKARRTLRAEEDSIEAKRDRRRSVTAAASAKARQSVYSLNMPANSFHATIPEGTEILESSFGGDVSQTSINDDIAQTSLVPFPLVCAKPLQSAPALGLPSSASFAALLGGTGVPNLSAPLPLLEEYNAPAWVPDSRADRCMSCSETFGVWRRKHHCRLCGRVVCWSCSTKKFLIASYEEGKDDIVARACDGCYESTFPSDSPDLDSLREVGLEGVRPAAPAGASTQRPDSWTETQTLIPESHHRDLDSDLSSSMGDETLTSGGPGVRRSSEKLPAEGEEQGGEIPTSLLLAPLRALAVGQGLISPSDDIGPYQAGSSSTRKLSAGLDSSAAHQDDHSIVQRLPVSIAAQGAQMLTAGRLLMMSKSDTCLSTSTALSDGMVPQIHAATTGSGTFRLATPQITTPTDGSLPSANRLRDSGEPVARRALDQLPSTSPSSPEAARPLPSDTKRMLIGQSDSYFAGALLAHEDSESESLTVLPAGQDNEGELERPPSLSPSSLSSPVSRECRETAGPLSSTAEAETRSAVFAPNSSSGAGTGTKRPLSAAARLSSYYNDHLALRHLKQQSKDHSGSGRGKQAHEATQSTLP
ncbi:hypothetical protein BCV69DRAFT_298862 [Microstroma glucosiphilum]|uniref:Uncharacterized protein n=1 Tax=Pseudomicrostroma glucosiphilum TaxID=1684307 RepID=A0A316U762_9BASI|nr:hypothetical protein BCV69DRAFT_298862 [Pseudomicrostroma glucosiphilum]PWN21077.1 hypothetical protein BCV69DRAFT_298862 [Pseudomicrostroma glucosiphilum]